MSPLPLSTANSLLGKLEASILAESSLVDKESGRVFWEGGSSSTLSASLYPKIGVPGFTHLKATLLSSLLLLALVSVFSHWVRKRLEASQLNAAGTAQGGARPLYQSIGLFVLQWTLLRTPNFNGNFVIFLFVLYLIEAHTCSTRRYLANAIISPSEVEEFIEKLRNKPPVVTWKVRCFHYEKPYWLSPGKSAKAILKILTPGKTKTQLPNDDTQINNDKDLPPILHKEADNISGPFRRKVVSHQATAKYAFSSFADATVAGVWKRQKAVSSETAPFMKIVLSKILVLANADAKNEYFRQQSSFVTNEGMRDKFAEYSTSIEVEGFKRRMLAIRPVEGVPSAKLFRLNAFWVFTLMGLSLPYRLWFARHCDYLRVTVVKETHAELAAKSSYLSSWFSSKPVTQSPLPVSNNIVTEVFRRQMQSLSLYAKKEEQQSAIALNNFTNIDVEGQAEGPKPPASPPLMVEQSNEVAIDTNTPEAQESLVVDGKATIPSADEADTATSLGLASTDKAGTSDNQGIQEIQSLNNRDEEGMGDDKLKHEASESKGEGRVDKQ